MVCTTPTRCGAPALHTKGPRCIGRPDGKDDCDCLNACGDDPWIESGTTALDLHEFQIQQLSAGEIHDIARKLIAQTQTNGGTVMRASPQSIGLQAA